MDLRDAVAHMLTDHDHWTANRLANREQYRERGYRLVQHEQEGRELVLYDALDGEELYRGSFEDAGKFFDDSPVPLANLDTIDGDVDLHDTPLPGVPEGLADKIRDWAESHPEEAREFVEGR